MGGMVTVQMKDIKVRVICDGTDVFGHDIALQTASDQLRTEHTVEKGSRLIIRIFQHVRNIGIDKTAVPFLENIGAVCRVIFQLSFCDIEKVYRGMPGDVAEFSSSKVFPLIKKYSSSFAAISLYLLM